MKTATLELISLFGLFLQVVDELSFSRDDSFHLWPPPCSTTLPKASQQQFYKTRNSLSCLIYFFSPSYRQGLLFFKGASPPSNLCQGRFIPFMAPQHFQSLLHNNSTKPYCSLQLEKERSFVMRRGLIDFVLRPLYPLRPRGRVTNAAVIE